MVVEEEIKRKERKDKEDFTPLFDQRKINNERDQHISSEDIWITKQTVHLYWYILINKGPDKCQQTSLIIGH